MVGEIFSDSFISFGEPEVAEGLAPIILAPAGFPVGWVTNLAFIITFWLGPGGPSVPSFTATPKDCPEVL